MILCENKRILRKKGSENFEANKRNACETDLCSLRFALKRKKYISENRTPYREADTEIMMRLPEIFLELVSVFKEANKNFIFNLICLRKIFI